MEKLLLHTCCGPCFLGVWQDIKNKFEVTNLFYNPNIEPKEEYHKRLKSLKITIKNKSRKIIESNYDSDEHKKAIFGLEKEFSKRCLKCYELRLRKTAELAKVNNYIFFSTTLLISPYQQHEALKEIGDKISSEFDVKFYYKDWRPFFRKGQERAKELDIHRQKYCGCRWSKKEAN